MNANITDVMVHVNESMDEHALHALEDAIREDRGVVSVGHNPRFPHLLLVAYDSAVARSTTFMHQFPERGMHAQLL
ncbi:MAG: hypothetical protein Q8M09_01540 [Pseudomonadota bacterium]|nr:hypothetical protein [Pseudomonadota bacterium]MDP1902927.1 hypothetical protein [Pseudomonadota bacterium]MDP2353026.1 hypothetical protein [Pseudomonadota bacterium]